MAPRAGVDQCLGVEPVDGVGHPVVEAEDVLDGDVGPAPSGSSAYNHVMIRSGSQLSKNKIQISEV